MAERREPLQIPRQLSRVRDGRLASESRTDYGYGFSLFERRQLRNSLGQCRRKILRNRLVDRQFDHGFRRGIRSCGNAKQLAGRFSIPDNHDLGVRMRQMHRGDPVGCGKKSVLPSYSRQDFDGLLRLIAQAFVIGIGMQP